MWAEARAPFRLLAPVRMFPHMERERVFRDTLALVNLADLARHSGRSRSSWEKYKDGRRRPTPDAARELIAYLNARSEELAQAAKALEAVAEDGGQDA